VLLFLLSFCGEVVRRIETQNDRDSDEEKNLFDKGTNSETYKRNCDSETVYAMSDEHCDLSCVGPNIYIEKNGACINVKLFRSEEVTERCDPRQGLLAFLLGDPQFGKTKWFCMSADLGIRPHDPDLPNAICQGKGARMDVGIDYLKYGFPRTDSCSCDGDERERYIVEATSAVRSSAICASSSLSRVLLLL
jgi:hypothetical protein